MHRWLVAILVSTLFCSLIVFRPLLDRWRAEPSAAAREQTHDRAYQQSLAAADALNLCRAPNGSHAARSKVILSELPLSPERVVRLHLNQPDHAWWRGTVAIYVGAAHLA